MIPVQDKDQKWISLTLPACYVQAYFMHVEIKSLNNPCRKENTSASCTIMKDTKSVLIFSAPLHFSRIFWFSCKLSLSCLPACLVISIIFIFIFVVQSTSLLKMIMWKAPAYTWTWLWIRHLHHSIEDSIRCRTWLLPRLHVGACPLWKKNSSPRWFFTRI